MTLMCIDRSQSPTHKGSFLQGGKSSSVSNINQQNANHSRRNSCSPPLSKRSSDNCNEAAKSTSNTDSKKLERSSSEGSDRRVSQSNSSRYKTELCRPFEESGICKYGDKCQFAHGMKELRSMARHPKYKTELCRTFHSTGLCPYGPRCHFIHNSEQTKKSMLTNLASTSSSPPTRPKALTSIGSAGDMSPSSSRGSSPTDVTRNFDDLFQQNPLSPVVNNVFFPQDNNILNNFQRYVDFPVFDYDSINGYNDNLIAVADNYGFQNGPVLDLCPVGPVTPPTPLDNNVGFFRLPIFDAFQKQQVN